MVSELMRRRMMMEASGLPFDYVQDGLVFQLDGINRGTTDSTKWIDLVGGLEWVQHSGVTAIWGNNHLICPSRMDCIDYPTQTTASPITLEIVFYQSVKDNIMIFRNKTKDGSSNHDTKMPQIGVYNGNYLLTSSVSPRITIPYTAAPIGNNYSFSISFAPCVMVNGVEITTGTKDYYTSGSGMACLGTHTGKIYAVRRYNRNLTTDEMLHNQRVDNERFQLGLTI